MKLVIAGGTGFIGSALCAKLLEKGHALTILTRSSPPSPGSGNKRWLRWSPGSAGEWEKAVNGSDGVINLAGESIAARRWTPEQKREIRSSRIATTRSLVDAIVKATEKPKFLINASAVGYYGPHGDETITEEAQPGADFLGVVCREWENEAVKAEQSGI